MAKSNVRGARTTAAKIGPFSRIVLLITPNWITPNMLSLLRLALVPAVIFLLLRQDYAWGLAVFLLAAGLDALDGILARGRGQITRLGLLLDPLSDKLLVIAVAACLLILYPFPSLIAYALAFDLLLLLVSAAKLARARRQNIQPISPSNVWGKGKMLCQVAGIALALLWLIRPLAPLLYLSAFIIWLSLAFQIAGALIYSRASLQR